ncbi:glutamine amidotransferase subunit PdxT [Tenericutes bacterium MZ-XQ]|nr:glutamine amidotransferase subunit PdxT [Tenericutes bacterium MZ-XQ]
MKIGIMALQGAFIEHKEKLDALNIDNFFIRNLEDLKRDKDGLILPGGESTAMYKLLNELKMFDTLKSQINEGLPTFGTCAGLILLAKNLTNQEYAFLKVMDVTVTRNAYGRQLSSFITTGLFNKIEIPMVFIRAPYIEHAHKDVEILSVVDGKIVAARQNHLLGTAFHPELTDDLTIHKYFVSMIDIEQK